MSDKKRIISFFIFLGLFSMVFVVGTETNVSEEDAQLFIDEFEKLVEGIDAIGIAFHNAMIALPMFIPGFGVVWGFFSAWQTGVAFAAFKTINPLLLQIHPLAVLYMTPFGLMELASYSIAMSRSAMLMYNILKKIPIKKDFKIIIIEVGIVLSLLIAGGLIEMYMIQQFEAGQLEIPGLD